MWRPTSLVGKLESFMPYGPIGQMFSLFQGRSTFFALVFTVVGIILAFKGKLDGNFSLMVAAIQGMVVAGSIKESYVMLKQAQLVSSVNQPQVTNVTNVIATPPTTVAVSSTDKA
jgi:hypothetical protein